MVRQIGNRAVEGVEEADLWSADMETGERACNTRELGVKWPQ